MSQIRLHQTEGAAVREVEPGSWRLEIPDGPEGVYRWAQMDDYMHRRRSAFLWEPPFSLKLSARVSRSEVPGTWGFGLWNDPFNLSFGLQGTSRRLPALPNAVWFFNASSANYLSLEDDKLAAGMLMAAFSSPLFPPVTLALGVPFLSFLLWPPTARLFRKLARSLVHYDAQTLEQDCTKWHSYELNWTQESAVFWVDGLKQFETAVVPRGKMGFVLWIDNQYAAFPPDGRIKFGTLESEQTDWLEVRDIQLAGKE